VRKQQESSAVQRLGTQALRVAARQAGGQGTVLECLGRWGGAVTAARDSQRDQHAHDGEACLTR